MLIIAALVVGFLIGATAIMVFASLAISDTSHYRKESAFYKKESAFYKKHAEDWEGLAMEYKQIAFELAAKTVAANLADPESSE